MYKSKILIFLLRHKKLNDGDKVKLGNEEFEFKER